MMDFPIDVVEHALRRHARQWQARITPDAAVALAAAATTALTAALGDAVDAARKEATLTPRKRRRESPPPRRSGGAAAGVLLAAGLPLPPPDTSCSEGSAAASPPLPPPPPSPPSPTVKLGHRAALWGILSAVRGAPRASPWYVVRVKPDNNCLFTSLRLVWEAYHAVTTAAAYLRSGGTRPPPPNLHGYSAAALREGKTVRASIVRWYADKPNVRMPGGERITADAAARTAVRSDIIALHLLGEARDADFCVPDTLPHQVEAAVRDAADKATAGSDDAEAAAKRAAVAKRDAARRDALITAYLANMARDGVWGSTPEWQAWAYMTKLAMVTYRIDTRDGAPPHTLLAHLATVPPLTETVTALQAPVPPDVAAVAADDRDVRTDGARAAPTPLPLRYLRMFEEGISPSADGISSSEEEEEEDGSSSSSDDEDDEEEEEEDDTAPIPFAGRLLHKASHYAVLLTEAEYKLLMHVHGDALCNGESSIVPLAMYIDLNLF